MKYYIIAGEASGDLHGSNLISALKKMDANAHFRCWGGDLMQEQSGELLVKHYRHLAFMGFVEVLKNIREIVKNLNFCQKDIIAYNPDALILIDYPGFNLRIAQFAKQKNIKVFYYISPQAWAWKENRVKKMKKIIDHLFVILPFEESFYREKWQWNAAEFVGHPLIDALKTQSSAPNTLHFFTQNKPIIALLPGSRKQEIERILPVMLSVVPFFLNSYSFIIAAAPAQPLHLYESILQQFKHIAPNIPVVYNQTYNIVKNAQAALVTSGTATLETALLKTPQVVCYKANTLSYYIARKLVKVPYISLVNLVLEKEAVKELIQNELNTKQLTSELQKILPLNSDARFAQLENYKLLEQKLGGEGASARTAARIFFWLQKKQ